MSKFLEKPKIAQQLLSDAAYYASVAKNSAAVYIGDNTVLTRIYTGQKMYVDTRDVSEAPHLMIDGVWEEEISKVYEHLIKPSDIVFDVGSTFGYFGVIAGTKLRKSAGARLFVIDANPVYEPFIVKNLTVNGQIEYSVVSNIALSGKRETLTLNVLKDDWASSTFQPIEEFKKHRTAPFEVEKTVKVKAMTLDQYCADHKVESADFIKLDIEGLEEVSYPGMKKLISNSPNLKMLFEFTTDGYEKPQELFKAMLADFDYIYCMPEGGEPVAVSSYAEMLSVADGSWIMLLLSKKDISSQLL